MGAKGQSISSSTSSSSHFISQSQPASSSSHSLLSSCDDIPPNHNGPIDTIRPNDVLCGRGGQINAHSGNVYFRTLVNHHRPIYLSPSTGKLEKVKVAEQLVTKVRMLDPPGRFLKENSGVWFEIGDFKARKKAGQAMREKGHQSSQVILKNKKKAKRNVDVNTSTRVNNKRSFSPCVMIEGNVAPSPPASPRKASSSSSSSSSSLDEASQSIIYENTCQQNSPTFHNLIHLATVAATIENDINLESNDTFHDTVMKIDNEEEKKSLQHMTMMDKHTRERLKIALAGFITRI